MVRGSGPTSMTTALPGPAARTRPSPCPTSQAARIQPSGGQPGNHSRTGISTAAALISTAAARRRTRADRSSQIAAATTAQAIKPPLEPPGTVTVAPGIAAKYSATDSNHHIGGAAQRNASSANGIHADASTAPAAPITVIGAMTGATRTFATTATRLIFPVSATTIGVVTTNAAAETASISAGNRHMPLARNQSVQLGASRINAPVASTERAKPADIANSGHSASSPITAAHRAGRACRRRPVSSASNVTAPMAAARRTLGSGLAMTTNITSAPAATPAVIRGPSVSSRVRNSTTVNRIVKFAPLTTVKWVSPAVSKSRRTSSDSAEVSPTTSAGSDPAAPAGSAAADAATRSARTDPANRCHHGSGPAVAGSPRACNVATVRSRKRGADTRARNSTGCPGGSFAHDEPVARMTTAPPLRTTVEPRWYSRRLARTSHVRSPPNVAPRTGFGSSTGDTTTRTDIPAETARSGWVCTRCSRQAAATAKPAPSTTAPKATTATARHRSRRCATAHINPTHNPIAATVAPTATITPTRQPTPSTSTVTAQQHTAAGSSRPSSRTSTAPSSSALRSPRPTTAALQSPRACA